jgi:hypothetical protein
VELSPPGDHGWVFDLIDPDPERRGPALARHHEAVGEWEKALGWVNDVWRRAGGTFTPAEPGLAAEMDQALTAQRCALEGMLPGLVGRFLTAWRPDEAADYRRLAPFAVLFLRWEVRYPQEWREAGPWSPWGTKRAILRRFAKSGPPPECTAALVDLVIEAVERENRCEDRGYALLARRLDGPQLRDRLDRSMSSVDGLIRLRAGYLRALLCSPKAPVTVAGWRRWLASDEA